MQDFFDKVPTREDEKPQDKIEGPPAKDTGEKVACFFVAYFFKKSLHSLRDVYWIACWFASFKKLFYHFLICFDMTYSYITI